MLVAAIVCFVGIAMVSNSPARARSASECIDSSWSGPLASATRHSLGLASINQSQWNGSGGYDAARYDSGGNVTYAQYVSAGYWQYGTAGNASRRSEIVNEMATSINAYVEQDKLC
jgi:hypothetical protein